MVAKHLHRPSPCSPLLPPSLLKDVMAVAAMEAALAASQAKVARKAVAMAAVLAAKVVVVAEVGAAAVAQTASRVRSNATASTPKESPCSRMPTCRARTLAHRRQPDKSNAQTGARATNVVNAATVQTAVANATRVASAVSHAQKGEPKVHQQPTETTKTAPTKAKCVSHAKAVADGADAMAVAHARTVKYVTQTAKAASPSSVLLRAKAPPTKQQRPSPLRRMTVAKSPPPETRTASRVRSAAVIVMAVSAVPGASAKNVLICVSRPNRQPRKQALAKRWLMQPLCMRQHHVWPMLQQPLYQRLHR